MHDQEFGDVIYLHDIFGPPGYDATLGLMSSARAYERVYRDPAWLKPINASKTSTKGKNVPKQEQVSSLTEAIKNTKDNIKKSEGDGDAHDSENDDSDVEEEEEVKYRVLNIFTDGMLDYVTYSSAPDQLILSAHCMDLVDALIFPLNQEMRNTLVFLAAFRHFMTPNKLLDALIEWYNVENDESCSLDEEQFLKRNKRAIQSRVVRVLTAWVRHHWTDFVNKKIFKQLMSFVNEVSSNSFGDSQKLTQEIREQRLSWYMTIYIPPFPIKKTSVSGDLTKSIGLLWDPAELAVQLTHIDHLHFSLIKPGLVVHLMSGAKKVGGGMDIGLKLVLEYAAWFRMISSYVASLIVREDSTKKKVHVIKRWIKIARECKKLNNFNTMFAVIHGLKRPFIVGLSSLWEQLPQKYIDTFFEMEKLTHPDHGYDKFWEEWKTVRPPAVPFFGAYMQDLLEISKLMATNLANGQVNMLKFYDLHSTLTEMNQYKVPYSDKLQHMESAQEWEFPQPGSGIGNPTLDYPNYVMTHMREWAIAFMIDDLVLDQSPK